MRKDKATGGFGIWLIFVFLPLDLNWPLILLKAGIDINWIIVQFHGHPFPLTLLIDHFRHLE